MEQVKRALLASRLNFIIVRSVVVIGVLRERKTVLW